MNRRSGPATCFLLGCLFMTGACSSDAEEAGSSPATDVASPSQQDAPSAESEDLLGKWDDCVLPDSNPGVSWDTIEFLENGTLIWNNSVSGTWQLIGEDRLQLNAPYGNVIVTWSIGSDGDLRIENPDGTCVMQQLP